MLIVQVMEPYSAETLRKFGVEPGTVEEYAFCLGWQDGANWQVLPIPPVMEDQLDYYTSGWSLGAWNRLHWLQHGISQNCEFVCEGTIAESPQDG